MLSSELVFSEWFYVLLKYLLFRRMSFQDFSKNFQKVEICNLGPDSVIEEASDKKTWEMTGNEGCWKKRVNAGGCRNFLGV